MKTIQIYDPPLCCSTGICGTDMGPDLVNFATMLSQLGTHGIKVERYNLGQQPMAFVQNPPDGNRPEVAHSLGATNVVNCSDEQAVERIMALTNDAGVDTVTTPMLLRIVQSGRLDPKKLVSHRFELSEIMKAYISFWNATKERALKIMLSNVSANGEALKEHL
ncbi:MAG: arsenic metallochaperone ArsD family protein [Nitrospirota bacterium]|nr:arsenic metallochaperone ArsD family protein [Nitrospirota bacterium]